ncbi:hypothetical protein [Cellulomonas sp. HZM]|uniref:hypothetical protein n=1 Tax=Cellulomonas sp. HZM TaxID=1454010 RepID=UPI0004938502|nr:hypothetical protein [Cellulomonas sp. HZM]
MTWVLLFAFSVFPTLVFALAFGLVPTADEPPWWRLVAARHLERLAARLRRPRRPVADPFAALWVQSRLGAVADHVRELELDPQLYARAERIIASQLAYDQLLAQACELAGVDVEPAALGDPQERFREEVELASRGWSW